MAPLGATESHDDDDVDAQTARAVADFRYRGWQRPIFETHIHFYQVTRPGGVPWPPEEATQLRRDVLPAEYKSIALHNGIVAAGVVEASPLVDDNQWILDLISGDAFYKFFVGSLVIGAPDFGANLKRFAKDRRFVGMRGFLWSPGVITLDAAQRQSLDDLSQRGMTLDIISRGPPTPSRPSKRCARPTRSCASSSTTWAARRARRRRRSGNGRCAGWPIGARTCR